MADLRIIDAPEIPTNSITGQEKLPTGGNGNYSISLNSVASYTKTNKNLADNTSVDNKVNSVRQQLNSHTQNLSNPHQVTKVQIGLGNVDNTADLDKPVSNSTQAAIISAGVPKADKTYVDSQDSSLQLQINQKVEASYVDTALSNLSTVANKFYPTLAKANTDIANIAVNQPVTVGEVANGGLWYKATAGDTTLTKSAYDPLVQAKADATTKANAAETNAKAYTDIKTALHVDGVLGKNLFNINAIDVALDKYVNYTNGALDPSSSYNATGFIKVDPTKTYTISSVHMRAFYDVNRNYIGGNPVGSPATFTPPASAVFVRFTVFKASWSTFQVEVGSTATPYEAYAINIDVNKIPTASITPPKVSFMEIGKNKFNINASDVALDKYVNYTNGALDPSSSYNTTGFIQVDPSKTYTLSYTHMRAFYDASRNFISGSPTGSPATFTPPAGAVFARFTVAKASWTTFQVEIGSTATAFEKFGYKFTSDVLISQGGSGSAYVPTLVLPPKIYVLADLESHIYPEHLLPESSDLYLHDLTCALGKQVKRGWVYTPPTNQASGNNAMSWAIADRQTGAIITSASTTVVVAPQATAGTKNVLVIGDSYVNAGVITQRLLDIAATDPLKLNLIGTRGIAPNKHEGRGGWTIGLYTGQGIINYKFTVSGVSQVPSLNATTYTYGGSTFLVQEVNVTGGNGTILCSLSSGSAPTAGSTGTLTKSNSSAGDASISFSNVQPVAGNPFWKSSSSTIDFANYLSVNSLSTPDIVLIQLGVNDTFSYSVDADVESFTTTAFTQLDTLIASIKAANSSVKIGIVAPPSYADQDAFGANYACNQTSWRAKRNIVVYNKKLYAYYKDKEASNIYVVAAGCNVDTQNNMQTTTQAVNSQNSTQITVQSNGVHPADSGYKQIGDALFAFLKAV